jgi:hypothetical protein
LSFCIWGKARCLFFSSAFINPIFPAPFIEETVLSPMYVLDTFVENQVAESKFVSFGVLYYVSLIYVSALCFEVRYCDASTFVVLLRIPWLFCIFPNFRRK